LACPGSGSFILFLPIGGTGKVSAAHRGQVVPRVGERVFCTTTKNTWGIKVDKDINEEKVLNIWRLSWSLSFPDFNNNVTRHSCNQVMATIILVV
jgi:hypothetical protein